MAPLRLVHVTTADISLDLLLGPQLRAFADAGYEVYGASAPGPHVHQVEAWGARHVALEHATRASHPGHDVAAGYREGFPRAAMEASASGLPIVATDIRGCRQVVEDGITGLLVPVRQPDTLADAIGQLVRDGDARARMGTAAGKKAIAEFDQRQVIETTLEVYDQVLQGGRRGRRRR